MQIKSPWVSRKRAEAERAGLIDEIRRLNIELTKAGNELSQARHTEITRITQVQALSEKLSASAGVVAAKQGELAILRASVAEKEAQLKAEREESRFERHKLTDWITTGLTGNPVFEKPAAPVEPAAPEKVVTPGSERVPTEIEDAVAKVGRRARSVVKHIEKQNDVSFEEKMAAAGVRKTFAQDRVEAEVEASTIAEKTA